MKLRAEEVYDCLFDDDLFSHLPGRLAEAFGARSALMHCRFTSGGAGVMGHSGYFTDEQMNLYTEEFATADPWAAAAAATRTLNSAIDLEWLVPPEVYERSVFFNEYIRPMGDDTFRAIGLRIERSWGSGMLGLQRGKTQAPFDAGNLKDLQESERHMRHLLSFRGRLEHMSQKLSTIEAVLDQAPEANLVVLRNLQIVYANAAAERLLRRGVLGSRSRRLVEDEAGENRKLIQAVQVATDPTAPEASLALLLGDGRAPIAVNVVPLAWRSGKRGALLTFRDPSGADGVVLEQLAALGLTQAEALIAERLSAGLSPEQVAAERQVSVNTVRSQMKALYSKLGCRRQAELAAIVRSLHSTLSQPPAQ